MAFIPRDYSPRIASQERISNILEAYASKSSLVLSIDILNSCSLSDLGAVIPMARTATLALMATAAAAAAATEAVVMEVDMAVALVVEAAALAVLPLVVTGWPTSVLA